MVKDDNSDKRLEKAMGLLSLAADSSIKEKREKGENCIPSEELAALIDNKCSEAEIEKIKNHLSECEICSDQWLTLSTFKMGALKTPRTVKKSKAYTYIGSALALAASVVVFLNIADITGVRVRESVPPTLMEKKDTTVYQEKGGVTKEEQRAQRRAASFDSDQKPGKPVPSEDKMQFDRSKGGPAQEKKSMGQMLKVEKNEEIQPALQAQRRPAPAVPDRATDSSKTDMRAPASPGERTASDQGLAAYESWKKAVYSFCQKTDSQMADRRILLTEGSRLLNTTMFDLPDTIRQKISIALPSIQRVEGDKAEGLCKDILAVLAQE